MGIGQVSRLAWRHLRLQGLGLACLVLAWAGQVPAQEVPSRFQTVMLPSPGGQPQVLALLSQAAGWSEGDAAVLLLWPQAAQVAGAEAPAARDALAEALLAAGASVLELDVPAAAPMPELLAQALRVLRTELGAGLLVVVGWGEAGPVALARAEADRLSFGQESPAIAAAVALAPAGPRFASGMRPSVAEAWPLRAALFCDALPAGLAPREVCLSGLRGR